MLALHDAPQDGVADGVDGVALATGACHVVGTFSVHEIGKDKFVRKIYFDGPHSPNA